MSKMRIWLFQGGQRYDPATPANEVLNNVVNEALLAEEVGFHGIFAAEHHFTNYASVTNPMIYIASLARITSIVRLATMGVVLPLHHPLRVAEDAAMIDQLSGGRFELGLARGFVRFEYEGLGYDIDESGVRMAEGLEIVAKYLSGTDVDYSGAHWNLPTRTISPAPLQSPPPMWYACGGPASIENALRHDMDVITAIGTKGMVYAESFAKEFFAACKRLGIDPSTRRMAANAFGNVGSGTAHAEHAAEQARHHVTVSNVLGQNIQNVVAGEIDVTGQTVGTWFPDDTILSGTLMGDEDHMRKVVSDYESLGFTDVSLNIDIGDYSHESRTQTIRAVSSALELKEPALGLR